MQPTRVRSALPVGLLLGLVSLAVLADTFTVAPPGTMPPPDFTTIQEAIDAAVDGDCVTVEPGTYVENIDFLGKAITVQSTGGQTVTIIDGNRNGSVVTFTNGETQSSVLEGFTVTNGEFTDGGGLFLTDASPTLINNTIAGNSAVFSYGGGVYALDSLADFLGCAIVDNYAELGAGVFIDGGSPTFTDCDINDNFTTPSGDGGGMFSFQSQLTLTSCNIVGNIADDGGGVFNNAGDLTITNSTIGGNMAAVGGGVSNSGGTVTITNSTISGNTVAGPTPDTIGGGVRNRSGILTNGILTITNTTISGNTGSGVYSGDGYGNTVDITDSTISGNGSFSGGGIIILGGVSTITSSAIVANSAFGVPPFGGGGGGIHASNVLLSINGSRISGNSASGSGGGIHGGAGGDLTITNSTISGNIASTLGGGGIDALSGTLTITNSVLWGDSPDEIESQGGDVTFSDVQGGYPGTGNIDIDPLFVDPDGPDDIPGNADDDYHLQPESPCINLGTNDPPGGLPLTDLDGNPRVVCSVVDMGAFEAAEPVDGCMPIFIRGDCDFDLVMNPLVDAIFLLNFGFVMGPTPPCLDACDADDSGDFNALVDGVYTLSIGATMGPPPPPPNPSCGSDPTADGVSCDSFVGCP